MPDLRTKFQTSKVWNFGSRMCDAPKSRACEVGDCLADWPFVAPALRQPNGEVCPQTQSTCELSTNGREPGWDGHVADEGSATTIRDHR